MSITWNEMQTKYPEDRYDMTRVREKQFVVDACQ